MNIETVKTRVDELLTLGKNAERSVQQSNFGNVFVNSKGFSEFRAASLSFIKNVFGENHTFYKEFEEVVSYDKAKSLNSVDRGIGVLRAIKQELDGGWLFTVRNIVAADIFTDFLEMANYLLVEGYKDPAAVMIGGVLEEHLRQLCNRNGIDIAVHKDGKDIPKTADRMNADLAGAGIYSRLYHKGVTGWLDLRNKAAHGHYNEYDKKQVEIMEQSVVDFITKTN
ncbi:hypothetical protein E4631_24615 [Hymenobacter sp. UV11]|uniref:hypothetical protein n=1 Tax=Hymenobacter sp. UV11 TaxID=1849735 RepID=UPI00105F4569|nr:hypothetical protein [Hymenobacter sp. UV11]TDN35877.1 hypothetical protein A8B98_11900 [Hymenobacter sp. UV11]TFZ62739.1 hypothetical protein E4631_24615 [Hymenobacter sp. UV11]